MISRGFGETASFRTCGVSASGTASGGRGGGPGCNGREDGGRGGRQRGGCGRVGAAPGPAVTPVDQQLAEDKDHADQHSEPHQDQTPPLLIK